MWNDPPRILHPRFLIDRGTASLSPDAYGELPFTPVFAEYLVQKHRPRVRGPQHWWRSARLRAAVAAHPDVGPDRVSLLLPWLFGLEGEERAAHRAGISVLELSVWKATCTRVAQEVMAHYGQPTHAPRTAPGAAGIAGEVGWSGARPPDDRLAD